VSLFDVPTWEGDPETAGMLEYGREYVAIGPAEGSKFGPPQRLKVTGLVDGEDGEAIGYEVVGIGKSPLPSRLVLFGCERFWRPL
jgi:hypothetical protein